MQRRAKIDSEGRVTIPDDIRKALGIGEDDLLIFEENTGEIHMRVVRKPVGFADYAGTLREGKGMGWEEINSYIRDLRGHNDAKGLQIEM